MNNKAFILVSFIAVIVFLISINLLYLKLTITMINSNRNKIDDHKSKSHEKDNLQDTKEIVSFLKYTDADHEKNLVEAISDADLKRNSEIKESINESNTVNSPNTSLDYNNTLNRNDVDHMIPPPLEGIPKETHSVTANKTTVVNTTETYGNQIYVEENTVSVNSDNKTIAKDSDTIVRTPVPNPSPSTTNVTISPREDSNSYNYTNVRSNVTTETEIREEKDEDISRSLNITNTNPHGKTHNTPSQGSHASSHENHKSNKDHLKHNEMHDGDYSKNKHEHNTKHDLKEEREHMHHSKHDHKHHEVSHHKHYDDKIENKFDEICKDYDEDSDIKHGTSQKTPLKDQRHHSEHVRTRINTTTTTTTAEPNVEHETNEPSTKNRGANVNITVVHPPALHNETKENEIVHPKAPEAEPRNPLDSSTMNRGANVNITVVHPPALHNETKENEIIHPKAPETERRTPLEPSTMNRDTNVNITVVHPPSLHNETKESEIIHPKAPEAERRTYNYNLTAINPPITKEGALILLEQNLLPINSENKISNPIEQSKLITEFNKGNYEMIFYIISFLSLTAIILFSYEVYRNNKTNQILSGDISKYEYLLLNDENNQDEEPGLRDM